MQHLVPQCEALFLGSGGGSDRMADRKSESWFYPKPIGDPARDRNARTLQVTCFLLGFAVSTIAVLDTIERENRETPLLIFAVLGLVAAGIMNRAGRPAWAARTAFLALLSTAVLLVFEARDGFRSHAMLIFPALLFIFVMFLDRASYLTTAAIVLVAVAAVGTAERFGLTAAIPHVRTTTNYGSIFFVDLALFIFAVIGSRIVRDTQSNVTDLRAIIDQLSAANLALNDSAHALRQSEMKYRRLHESITDAVVVVDMTGHILETNPTFQSTVGYTAEELCRLTQGDLTPQQWKACEARIIAEQVLTRGQSEVYEKEYRRRDGTTVPIELRTYLLRNEHSEPIGMWSIVRDITARKHDEQVISDGERRLRIARDAAGLGIYHYDVAAGTIFWDARVRQFWGIGPDEPVTIDTFFSGLHPDDRARTKVRLDRALDPPGGGEYYAEYRVISRADGSERWIGASGQVFFENGRAVHMIGAGQDISERKRAEAALRESEERFRRVFEEGPLGLGLVGKDFRFLKVNGALCQMVGYPEAELVQKKFSEITHPDDVQNDVDLADRLFRREIPYYRIQKRYVKKTGEIIWINLTASILLGPDGEPSHGLAMIEDITEVKRSHEEALVRQKLESVGTLAGGIAHDFNNLLGGVLGQAEAALTELEVGASPEECLKVIRQLAIHGSDIVRQLMIYAGKESEGVEQVDLSRTIAEMTELLKVSVSKHATLATDLGRGLPAIQANAAQIRRIVMNLVTNASEAIGDREGTIRVTTRFVAAAGAAVLSKTLRSADYLELEVSDTGCGMPQEMQAKVFDPFFTTRSVGRGLGLAVVHGIVRNLGGTIHLASEPGRGTIFHILLPGIPAAPQEAANNGSAPQSSAETLAATVLIVEDEDGLRRAVAKGLRRKGASVLEAAHGSAAIELLREYCGRIDVVLLDLTIPGATSQQVLAEAVLVRPDLKVILTSAYSEEVAAASVSAPNIRGFIRKPFALGDLVNALRKTVSS